MFRLLSCFLIVSLLVTGLCLVSAQDAAKSGTELDYAAQPVVRDGGVTRVLVLGLDRSEALTDSIFIVSVSEPTREARILQIPRDTYAAYTDRDYKKLNGAYASLGMEGLKQFLSGALGVSIHYVLALDLDSVSTLVDAVGGVDLNVPQAMEYTDPAQNLNIRLEEGNQHLNGAQAERFLRFRSGYVTADLGRMDAQKLFLRAYAEKCRTLGGKQMLSLVWKLLPNAQTDLPVGEAIRLMRLLPEIDPANVPMLTAPGMSVQGTSGAWYYSLNRAGMIRAVNSYLIPQTEVTEATFDPGFVFDRKDLSDFHNIYTAPDLGSEEVSSHI